MTICSAKTSTLHISLMLSYVLGYLKQVFRLLPKGSLILIGSLPDGGLQMGEEGPHQVVAVEDVAVEGQRAIRHQEPTGLLCVTVHWRNPHNETSETIGSTCDKMEDHIH